jgi:phosphoribosyl-AMP cyclohydrolase
MNEQLPHPAFIECVVFNTDGLVPAIAQDYASGAVLMLAWMNREALDQTLQTGQVTYWSRSRNSLWRKGETSGHTQKLMEAWLDCDGDALLLRVEQTGPACHTGQPVCFFRRYSR